ncbi:MAG: rRNA methyltransferase [Gammaproteobacteria bacterium]|nr:rRNA methyltransferase [Gammaproteobacteria bacterium]
MRRNKPQTPSRHPRSPTPIRREVKYYGQAACWALWQNRARDIIRIYVTDETMGLFGPALKWVAAQRKAYHIVTNDDIERLTESIHHQGVCILAYEASALDFSDLVKFIKADGRAQMIVYLDGVENPHNLGAIIRTCAHFGIRFIVGPEKALPRLSSSACRVAEGGAEKVALCYLQNPAKQLKEFQQLEFKLCATAVGKGKSLYRHHFPGRTLLILGAEGEGVSRATLASAETTLCIPGSGDVESLNVSVAFGVIAGEFYRQQHLGE